jgi:hypothetical protein
MRAILGFVFLALSFPAVGAEGPLEVDPNTKTHGGADVRGSGANAGAGAQTDNKIETDKSAVGVPSETRGEVRSEPRADERGNEDKPISERKPQEREPEDAAKGATVKPQ